MNKKPSILMEVLEALVKLLSVTVNTKMGVAVFFIIFGLIFIVSKMAVESNPIELLVFGSISVCLGLFFLIKRVLEIKKNDKD